MKSKTEIVLDLLVQITFVVFVFIDREAFWWVLFVGGAWQQISFWWQNYPLNDANSNKKLYWKAAKILLIILIVSGVLVLLVMASELLAGLIILAFLGLVISLFGGIILYIVYFTLRICDFLEVLRLANNNEE